PPQLMGGPLTDGSLADKPAFADLSLESSDTGPVFLYRSGLAGRTVMEETLKLLASPAPKVAGAAGVLSQPGTAGTITDMDVLIAQAREFMPVEARVKTAPFSRSAFLNKNLSLGEALEWGAWLSGRGLRQENNTLLLDEFETCYGPRQWQVLSLKAVCERSPELAVKIPARIAELLPMLYPTFFPDSRALYRIRNAVVFHGDRRQLRVAQRLLADLEIALDDPQNKNFPLQTWRPKWRADMEAKLSEPFVSSGADKLTGGFAWLLRQSVLSSQLHCTVLVDPSFMKDHWSDEVKNLSIANLTVAQVIERLAARVGLKMTIEGEVVWLKP
ncbi:MAG TPA: hypothetical protein VEJ63_08140, partial [Planctomycetota bacterium]|nr:hypothetical protein [Planctomycetota bacterium]